MLGLPHIHEYNISCVLLYARFSFYYSLTMQFFRKLLQFFLFPCQMPHDGLLACTHSQCMRIRIHQWVVRDLDKNRSNADLKMFREICNNVSDINL